MNTTANLNRAADTLDADAGFGPEVRCSLPSPGNPPLFIEPVEAHLANDLDAGIAWFRSHREAFEDAMVRHGAVVLRGFAIPCTDEFARLVEHFPQHAMGYAGGATVRKAVKGNVFEATRVPPEVWIMLHQEMAYLPNHPRMLAFYCHKAPAQGGETTIGDMRRFTAALPARLMRDIAQKGIRYKRNFLSSATSDGRNDPLFAHRTWEQAFYTDDRKKVEADCRERGLEFEWLPDGSLNTWNRLPGTLQHRRTGDTLWFNQLHTQTPHQRWMGDATWEKYSRVYGDTLPKPFDACYGDGSTFADEDILTVYDLLDRVTVSFPWRPGDVMFVDNLLTAHGRNPFRGERDVQVALLD